MAEIEKNERQVQQQQERDDEMREMALRLRRRYVNFIILLFPVYLIYLKTCLLISDNVNCAINMVHLARTVPAMIQSQIKSVQCLGKVAETQSEIKKDIIHEADQIAHHEDIIQEEIIIIMGDVIENEALEYQEVLETDIGIAEITQGITGVENVLVVRTQEIIVIGEIHLKIDPNDINLLIIK